MLSFHEFSVDHDGLKTKAAKTKAQIQSPAPRLQTAWRRFLQRRKEGSSKPLASQKEKDGHKKKDPWAGPERKDAIARLTRRRSH